MGIFSRKKGSRREIDVKDQPDAAFRRQSEASDERYRREHRLTTESERFNDEPDASEQERGFPAEGEQSPSTPAPH